MNGMRPPPVASVGLVGRIEELARLETALETTVAGQGCSILIAGEAGIGKTRLVEELADRARSAGALVLTGRCLDLVGSAVPYLAFAEALHPLGCSELTETAARSPATARPAERQLSAADLAARRQLRLFDEVRAKLQARAADSTVVLVIEDLHWADVSTLDLVSFLAHATRGSPILQLATYRSDEVRAGQPLHRWLTNLRRARAADVLELGSLRRGDLLDLLRRRSRPELSDDIAETICRRSGGNPFFAEELLFAVQHGEEELPLVLRDALLQRLEFLDDNSRSAVRVLAAAGRDTSHALLAAVVSVPEPDLREALRQAVRDHVITFDQARGTYRLRHALLAEAVYGTLLPGEREGLHGRIALALTESPALATAPTTAAELAHHWARADRPVEALMASLDAAAAAEAVNGLTEAVSHLERVLALWPAVPAADKLAGTELTALLARTAELADLTGDGHRAAELVRQALDLVDADEDPVRVALLYERLGAYLLPTGARSEGLAACRRAVDLVPTDPPSPERAQVLTTLGNALMLSWRHAESQVVCEEAVAAAAAGGDDRPAIRARGILGIDLTYLGNPAAGLAQVLDARSQARELGTPRDIAHSYALWCEVLIAGGRPTEAATAATEGLGLARDLGVERSFGSLLAAYAAEALLETGDWDRADELLSFALRPQTAFWAHYPLLVRAQLAVGRGDLDAARADLALGSRAEREPTSAARHARVTAELALWDGQPSAAAAAVAAGLNAIDGDASAPQSTRLGALGLRAEADQIASARRDPHVFAAARRRGRRLLTQTQHAARTAAATTPDAAAWSAVAAAEWARMDTAATAPARWQAAAGAWLTLGRPGQAAYCQWRCAEAHLTAKSPRTEVRTQARAAYRTATLLGARLLQREVELLAVRARLDLAEPPTTARDSATRLGITSREAEVLDLVASGYTNAEIAAALMISVKTASVHVTHILQKLGVSSRVEAAGIAHRAGVSPTPRPRP